MEDMKAHGGETRRSCASFSRRRSSSLRPITTGPFTNTCRRRTARRDSHAGPRGRRRGREHALVWKLSRSPKIGDIFCAPGNGGISRTATCVPIEPADTDGLFAFAKKERVDLVVVGPENALAAGIADRFAQHDIPVFGPTRAGAAIETSKVFAKALMEKYAIPTAPSKTFEAFEDALDHVRGLTVPYVVKADGLAAGKGAYVIGSREEGEKVVRALLVDRIHGEAGKKIIVEEFLPGIEASYLAFSDGSSMRAHASLAGPQGAPRRRQGAQHGRHGRLYASAVYGPRHGRAYRHGHHEEDHRGAAE